MSVVSGQNNSPEYTSFHGGKDYIALQHVERYIFASAMLKPPMKVLDIATGSGYGSAMLAADGHDVTGVDYDSTAVSEASVRWKGVRFTAADALALPFEPETFDAVVSFETIEHVHDGRAFLREMRRVLKPGGIFICSTPNIKFTSHPDYHVREYEPGEFYKMVEESFPGSKHYAQYFKPKDRLRDLYCWYLKDPLWNNPLMKAAKKTAKRILRRGKPQAHNNPVMSKPQGGSFYAVVPHSTTDYLRIMLTVSSK